MPGASATAFAAAWANWLLVPTTNFSNVYFWFRELSIGSTSVTTAGAAAEAEAESEKLSSEDAI